MNIGAAAKATGMTAKMIRHYESIGLLKPGRRTAAGYRRYEEQDLHTLRFVRHARQLGFSLEQIGELLTLWQDPGRHSKEVKRIVSRHVAWLNNRIADYIRMRDTLNELATRCAGDHRPDCPILVELAEQGKPGMQPLTADHA